jgi:hypothetical protein
MRIRPECREHATGVIQVVIGQTAVLFAQSPDSGCELRRLSSDWQSLRAKNSTVVTSTTPVLNSVIRLSLRRMGVAGCACLSLSVADHFGRPQQRADDEIIGPRGRGLMRMRMRFFHQQR